jgi:long-chain acyl-CoA synthetase
MFTAAVRRHPERPAITYAASPARAAGTAGKQTGDWRTLSWHELAELVLDVAAAMDLVLGGARTVAILADTDARYPIMELAVGLTGRTLQPLYATSTDDELRRALALTGADLLVLGGSQRHRADLFEGRRGVVLLDEVVCLPGVAAAPRATLPADVEPFDTRSVEARLAQLPDWPLDRPLLYLQSTGTTGPARVIEISESAVVQAVRSLRREASHDFPRFLSFLPPAHISERLLTLYLSIALAGHTWYGGGLATLGEDLRACRPTVLLAPPVLLEVVRAQAIAGARATRIGRGLLASVERTAGRMLATGIAGRGRRSWGARLFGRQLRRGAGLDQVRDALTGMAPVPPSLQAWFEAVQIPLRVVYGQTELAGATSMTPRRGGVFGSVGLPVRGVEVAVSDRGELLVRASSVFTRYVGDQAATAHALEGQWLHTGDRAAISPQGDIVLCGRVQSLVEAKGGATVDIAALIAEATRQVGDGEFVFVPSDGRAGVLYAALRADLPSVPEGGLRPVRADDKRWTLLARLVEKMDPHGVISGWALFEGAFGQTSGEVGPTGKPRGWRIHELRSGTSVLRARACAGARGDE